jgi:hypothetical protein
VQVTRSVVDASMIDAFVRLSASEYGDDAPVASAKHLRWKYLSCPAGHPEVDTLQADGEVIGRIVYEPRRLCSRAGQLLGLNPIDLLIHPRHRSPRAFLELMRHLRDHDGADLLFFVPNDVSAPLYERVLKFEQVGTLRLDGLPLRPEEILGRDAPVILRGLLRAAGAIWRLLVRTVVGAISTASGRAFVQISSDAPPDAELDRLADGLYGDEAWVGTRDHAFHGWRFRDGPLFTYRVRYARHRGTLSGYAASRIVDFEGQRACVVVDCVAASRRVARMLLADIVRDACRERADLVAALSFGDTALTRSLRRLPLMKVPRRFWPEQMPLHAEWVGAGHGDSPPLLALTLADMDVF